MIGIEITEGTAGPDRPYHGGMPSEADLKQREYEGADPQSSKGEKTYGVADNAMDLAYQLLEGAKGKEDVVAALKYAPGYVRAIVLVAQKRFGNDVVTQALYEANTADHTVDVKDRELLSTGAAHKTDLTAPAADGGLPWTATGWDALALNKALGQYDQIAGTDSDGDRCTFASSLASHIFKGPTNTVTWAMNYVSEVSARLKAKGPLTARQQAATTVINRAAGAISAKTATYGDLAWLQEGLHDLALTNDGGGANNSAYGLQDDDTKHLEVVSGGTCYTSDRLLEWAATLATGEQFMAEWSFPKADGSVGEHQILIVNQDDALYLYDSEIQGDGAHLRPLTAEALKKYYATQNHWIDLRYKLHVQAPSTNHEATPPPASAKKKPKK